MEKNTVRTVIRIIAGGYLAYLGYQIIDGYIHPTEETGSPNALFLMVGIAFIAIGVVLILFTLLKKTDTAGETQDGESLEEAEVNEIIEEESEIAEEKLEAEEAAAPNTMSIAERIRRLSLDDDDDEDSRKKDKSESEGIPEIEETVSNEEGKNSNNGEKSQDI